MLDCTSLNVWIQCIESGDFATNSERQQSTEGVQAWRWAVARSICEIANRWREYYLFSGYFVWICFLFTCCIYQQICSDHNLSMSHSSLQTLPFWQLADFLNNSSRRKCQMNVTLQLKLCESQQVLFNGMCTCTVFWVWFAWIHVFWATGSDKSSKPTPNLPFYSGFMLKPL